MNTYQSGGTCLEKTILISSLIWQNLEMHNDKIKNKSANLKLLLFQTSCRESPLIHPVIFPYPLQLSENSLPRNNMQET